MSVKMHSSTLAGDQYARCARQSFVVWSIFFASGPSCRGAMDFKPREDWHVGNTDDILRRLDRIEAARGDVVVVASDYPDGFRVNEHRHSRSQLLHALSGVVMISTQQGRWMVPPDHAMWIPAGVDHAVEMLGPVRMRSVYVLPNSAAGLPDGLRVLAMSDLMRGLVVEAVQCTLDASDARSAAIMRLILLEIPRLEERPLTLPFPSDPRLARLCRRFVEKPSSRAGIDDWAARAGMSRRSFTRAFQR